MTSSWERKLQKRMRTQRKINELFTLLIHRLEPHILEHEHYTKHPTPPRNPYRVNSNHREDRILIEPSPSISLFLGWEGALLLP